MVRNGEIDRTILNKNDGSRVNSQYDSDGLLRSQEDVFTNGTSAIKYIDTKNTHPYDKLDVTKGADGKVSAAQVTLDPTLLAAGATVGQIFGSELGAALGGKDQLSKLAGSAVGGAIGSLIAQKFVEVLATSMTADLSKVSLVDVFAGQHIDIAAAGIGAVSSFLTAELGSALHIDGFGGKLFNVAANGFTVSVLTQVTSQINAGLTFDAAIGAIDWSAAVSGAFNAAQLNVDGILGGYLAHEFVPAKTHEGAVGGALLGAIGNLILPGGLGSNGAPSSGGGGPHEVLADGGSDTLLFGPGIAVSDITISGAGNNLTVWVRDPAGAQPTDQITLSDWGLAFNRIEFLRFADGTVLDLSGGVLTPFEVPFGATFSGRTVAENSAVGTRVGTVAGFDTLGGAGLTYSLDNSVGGSSAGGRFAIDASTGVVTVANRPLLDYERWHSNDITVTITDVAGNYFNKTFTIATTDVFEAPSGVTLSKTNVDENAANGSEVAIATGIDSDPNAVLTYALMNDAAGRFAINASTGRITVANGALLDYEAGTSHAIIVRALDQQGHAFDKPFTIAVNDVYDPGPITGTSGVDHLTGHASADRIDGLAGNDILTGGAGDDTFVFRPGSGADIVTDFAAGAGSDDRLDLTAFASSYDLAYVLAHTAQSGADTVINLGGGDSITLQNVAKSNLSGSDFLGMQAFTYGGIWTPAGNGSDNTWHIGDFNGDGKDDIFRYLSDSGEQVFVSTGTGFACSGVWSPAGNGSDGKWHVGDFNGDGKDDVFRFIDGIGDQMFLSSGSSFYFNGVWTPAGAGVDGTWHVGDFNGDGKDDVFRYLGGEDVFLSNGSSFVHSGVWSPAGNGSDGKWYVGDFNGDGKDDIFRYLEGTGAQMFLSNGSSFVYNGTWSPAGIGVDGTWHVGDFNGDGRSDLFRYMEGQSGSDVLLSNGSSFVYDTVWTGAGIGVDNQWYVGDFNGGGADDIFRYLSGVGMFPSAFG
jgi:hypothetical protein